MAASMLMPRRLYAQRPEWADVMPVYACQLEPVHVCVHTRADAPAVSAPHGVFPADATPVVSISYTAEYEDVMAYVRGVLASGELSPRVLALTRDAILAAPAWYTTWNLRRQCILRLLSSRAASAAEPVDSAAASHDVTTVASDAVLRRRAADEELQLCADVTESHGSKIYQLWNHRQWIMCALANEEPDAAGSAVSLRLPSDVLVCELTHVEEGVAGPAAEPKNYHAWSYRQWLVGAATSALVRRGCAAEAAALWRAECVFSHTCTRADVRNNSAWNHRWLAICQGGREPVLDAAGFAAELDFITSALSGWTDAVDAHTHTHTHTRAVVSLHNESAWNYLRALVRGMRYSLLHESLRPFFARLEPWLIRADAVPAGPLPAPDPDEPRVCTFVNEFYAEMQQERASAAIASGDVATARALCEDARSLFLACALDDLVRKKYWAWRAEGVAIPS